MASSLFLFIEKSAFDALAFEISITPKPGLVDLRSLGAHNDMSAKLLMKSARAISPYIANAFDIGRKGAHADARRVFERLRENGKAAESEMLASTNGINTHKGAIFALSILACAYGRICKAHPSIEEICKEAGLLSRDTLSEELNDIRNRPPKTHGERAVCQNILGARGEALSGYRGITRIALPAFKEALSMKLNENDAGVYALLRLISETQDTCLYARGGEEGMEYAMEKARRALQKKDRLIFEAKRLDRLFKSRNLSPGGCADLISAAKFLMNIVNNGQYRPWEDTI
ncbi:MAG: triphosphoribosyl-dephospho-CoA synthase [Clostridia bacterium]|nr:triphosphoribosyl-dephospho-CoA synthase [Clostridia bacterium]